MYQYVGKVIKIVDGDTIDVLVDLGFSCFKKVRCRLAGIDVPEAKTDSGKLISAFLATLIADRQVVLESKKLDKYGRAIAKVWLDQQEISEILLEKFPDAIAILKS